MPSGAVEPMPVNFVADWGSEKVLIGDSSWKYVDCVVIEWRCESTSQLVTAKRHTLVKSLAHSDEE